MITRHTLFVYVALFFRVMSRVELILSKDKLYKAKKKNVCPWFVIALLLNSAAPLHQPACAELIRRSCGNSLVHMTVGCANNGLQGGQSNVTCRLSILFLH